METATFKLEFNQDSQKNLGEKDDIPKVPANGLMAEILGQNVHKHTPVHILKKEFPPFGETEFTVEYQHCKCGEVTNVNISFTDCGAHEHYPLLDLIRYYMAGKEAEIRER